MKTNLIISLLTAAAMTVSFPASAYAAEAAPAFDPEAEESEIRDEEAVPEGVQTDSSADEETELASYTEQTFPFYLYDPEDSYDLPLYFINDISDLPYIDLADLGDMLVTIYQYCLGDTGYELNYETDDSVALITRESGYSLLIDFENCTLDFEDYDAFIHYSGDNSLLDMVAADEYDEDGNSLLFQRIDKGSFDRYGREIEIDLADYDIPLYWSDEDGLYLIPLQTVSDLLISPNALCNLFFNGEAVYLADESAFGLDEEELTPLGESYYSAPYDDMSEELAWFNYCELCLALDHLYGLKEIHDITSFDRIFTETGYRTDLCSTDPNVADGALFDFIHYYLDDQHSAFNGYSFRTEEMQAIGGYGLSTRLSNLDEEIYLTAREQADHRITPYEEVGNTAYITFDHFGMFKQASEYYDEEPEIGTDPASDSLDTVSLVLYAHEQICRENSPVENVVIDLSLNGGGDLDAAAFVTAWYLGESAVSIRSSLTGAVSTGIYRADTDLNGKFDENDTVEDKNLFCLIGPYSFSCGNLVPNIFKASHRVTLLGQTTGGGSCSVLPLSTADGALFQISSPNRMSYMKNGSYYDTDTGIDPDCVIVRPSNFYDREALTEYIDQLF